MLFLVLCVHKYPAILEPHQSEENNLTKKLILQNIIMLLLFVYRVCTYLCTGPWPEADCTGVQCTGLVSGRPLAPAPPSAPAPMRPGQPRATTVQSGEAEQREKIHNPPVISVVVLLLLLLLLFFLLPPPITKKC